MNAEWPPRRSWKKFSTRLCLTVSRRDCGARSSSAAILNACGLSITGVIAALLLGCSGPSGPEKVSVSGTVSIDGKSLEQGTISFVSLEGGRTSITKIADGEYYIARNDGPYPGPQKVVIQAFQKTGKMLTVDKPLPTPPGEGRRIPPGGLKIEEKRQILPARYNSESTLKTTLESGNNKNVDFDLTLAEE